MQRTKDATTFFFMLPRLREQVMRARDALIIAFFAQDLGEEILLRNPRPQ